MSITPICCSSYNCPIVENHAKKIILCSLGVIAATTSIIGILGHVGYMVPLAGWIGIGTSAATIVALIVCAFCVQEGASADKKGEATDNVLHNTAVVPDFEDNLNPTNTQNTGFVPTEQSRDFGKEWQFGSDHLPVGVTVNNHHFASWNVLNKRFLHWIEKNEQGLKESAILQDNTPFKAGSSLTVREKIIIDQIVAMATHPTHPRSVIGLQEVHPDLFYELKKRLPACYVAVSHLNKNQGEVLFYNAEIFKAENFYSGIYANDKNKTWVILEVQEIKTKRHYTFIHSHVPGGKNSNDARDELSQKVSHYFNRTYTTVIMGDQNRPPIDFYANLESQFVINPFVSINIPYATHVNTRKNPCHVDNFFVSNAQHVRVSDDSKEFFPELEIPLALLQATQPRK